MFGWGIVSTGKHPDIKIAPAMAAADGGELVGVYSRDQHLRRRPSAISLFERANGS